MARRRDGEISGRLRAWWRQRELRSDQRVGTHSRRQLRDLRRAWLRRGWKAILALLGLASIGAIAAWVFLPDEIAPYVVGATLASGFWLSYVLMLQTGGVMPHVLGVMGEEWTYGELNKLRRRGWFLANHVMLEYVDVDHVVLGPGGFFIVESKFRSQVDRITEADLAAWSRRAIKSAHDVQVRLRTKRQVEPIIAVWGPGCREQFSEPTRVDGVVVCSGTDLVTSISASSDEIADAEVRTAFDHLDGYVSKRDIGEERDHGKPVRRLSDYSFDFLVGSLAALLSIWLAFASASLPLGGLWLLVTTASIGIAAAVLRRTLPDRPRVRAITTGCIGAAGALLLLFVAIVVLNIVV